MNNTNLKKLMKRGNITVSELDQVLYGKGSGSDEQYEKVYVLCDGVKLTEMEWFPGRAKAHTFEAPNTLPPIPTGDCELVWEHTAQRCAIDRDVVIKCLDSHASAAADRANSGVVRAEMLGLTKTGQDTYL